MVGKTICIAAIFMLAFQAAASAAGVIFSDRAAYQAAVGAQKTYSFDPAAGFPLAPSPISSADGTFPQFSSNGGPASLDTYGAAPNQALTGRLNNQVDRSAVLTIVPAPGTLAFAFDILDLGSPQAEQASIIIADGTDRITFPLHVQDNDGNPATAVFFGVIWDAGITSVDVYAENLLCAGPGVCYTPNLIDNLTVPEPSAVLLLLATSLVARRPKCPSWSR